LPFIVAVTLAALLIETNAVSLSQDLTLTKSQKAALDKFKANVLPKLTQDYQKSDLYLIRWLRAKNFNIKDAEEMLKADLKWRKAERMDDIHKEDWSDMQEEFPWYMDGYDNEGKPIVTTNFDEWDIRKGVVAGKIKRLMRWMTFGQESAVRKVRELQGMGKNVTQWDFIINMNNFNIPVHGCAQCLPIYTNYVLNYEKHYPGSVDKMMLLNTPQVFEVVLNLIRPVMSQQTRDALKVYTNNKDEWEHIVFADIKRDQLVKQYGGTKVRT